MDGIAASEQQIKEEPQIQIYIKKWPSVEPQFESLGLVRKMDR
jgi:hypothetical protein